MRNKLAFTKGVNDLAMTFDALATRDYGVPGMCLVHGYTGAGKTTAVTWLVNRTRGVYVRATSQWTPSTMLGSIMRELGASPLQRRQAMLDHIVEQITAAQRPLFVDEADYLLREADMLEALRDVHDLTNVPVILVGMQGIERRLVHRPQLARRLSHWVEFRASDLDDARTLAATVCEVGLDDELLARLHTEAKGSIGLMTVGMARIESLGKANGWTDVSADLWGDRKLFIGGGPRVAAGAQ
ncbi:MAG: ATP-binding protein [Burkholderiaceae bacterium]|jgi:DNA transposition AAA+ family ATPase|nr:ATP-binding protein [Burkholderiaceae bacterium]